MKSWPRHQLKPLCFLKLKDTSFESLFHPSRKIHCFPKICLNPQETSIFIIIQSSVYRLGSVSSLLWQACSLVLSYVQANTLAHCRFMDADRWHEIPELESKDYYSQHAGSASMFTPVPLVLPHEGSQGPREGVQTEACTLSRLHYERGKVNLVTCCFTARSQHTHFFCPGEWDCLALKASLYKHNPGRPLSGLCIAGRSTVLSWMVVPPKIFLHPSLSNLWILPYIDWEALNLRLWRLPQEDVGRNMNIKATCSEGSEGNEEHVAGDWRKGEPGFIVAESLVWLCPPVVWEVFKQWT